MFDNVLQVMESLHSITESFHAFLLHLHGPSHDDFLKLGGLFAWAETLTVIAAAYMKRMIPLRALWPCSPMCSALLSAFVPAVSPGLANML